MSHLSRRTLEELAEGALPAVERTRARTHLGSCARCAAELASVEALLAALRGLPELEPSPSFAEAVMARVRIARAPHPVLARLHRLLPRTRRGWRWATAAMAAPAAMIVALAVWLLSLPALSPGSMARWAWVWLTDTASDGLAAAVAAAARIGVPAFVDAVQGLGAVVPLGLLTLTVLVVVLAAPVSAWSLARLLRTPNGETFHAR